MLPPAMPKSEADSLLAKSRRNLRIGQIAVIYIEKKHHTVATVIRRFTNAECCGHMCPSNCSCSQNRSPADAGLSAPRISAIPLYNRLQKALHSRSAERLEALPSVSSIVTATTMLRGSIPPDRTDLSKIGLQSFSFCCADNRFDHPSQKSGSSSLQLVIEWLSMFRHIFRILYYIYSSNFSNLLTPISSVVYFSIIILLTRCL